MENATIDIETVETKSSYRDCEELCLCLVLETSGRTFVFQGTRCAHQLDFIWVQDTRRKVQAGIWGRIRR